MKFGYDAKRIFHNKTGLGNYCRDMIRILRTFYPDHQYLLYNPKPGKVDRLSPDGTNVIERRPNKWYWRFLNSMWRQAAVLRQAEQDGCSLYHGLTGELPRGIDKFSFKSVVTVHDLIFISHPHLYKPVDRRIYLNKLKHAVQKADKIIAISQFTKDQIVLHLGIEPDKIDVIYQTCHNYFKSSLPIEFLNETRTKYNLPQRFILNVGTIEKRKNLLALIKAIKDDDYTLIVVGKKTNYYNEIEKYIVENKMKDRVHFLDEVFLKELAAIYQMANLMVYTSLIEGFGIPIIEALYTSTPVICHHEGVFPEAAGPGSLYVDMENVDSIRNKIQSVWDNPDTQSRMIAGGLNHVANFEDKVIANDVMELYSNLINNNN